LDEAGRSGQRVEIVYAFEFSALGGWVGPGIGPGVWPDEVTRREIEAMLRSAQTTAATSHPGVTVRAELLEGPASLLLAQPSARSGLVVLGSRGHGGFAGLLVGSTAVTVSAHAHCPVVVVRHPAVAARPVVVGVDGSECSLLALDFAAARAAARGVALRAL